MKRIVYFTIIAVLAIYTVSSVQSVISLTHKRNLLVAEQKQLQKEQSEHSELEAKLSVVQSSQFVEEEARNKLMLIKPGEKTAIIVKKDAPAHGVAETMQSVEKPPYWEAWMKLFF